MLRTLYALRHVPLGFRTDHLLLTTLTVPTDRYKDRNLATEVWQPLLDQIQTTPGVRAAALSTVLPITIRSNSSPSSTTPSAPTRTKAPPSVPPLPA